MANWEDLLPTPEGYATPEQLASARMYANALLKKSTETRPIYNKAWGGLNMMAQALGGTFLNDQAAKQEKAALRQGATDSLIDVPGGAPEAPNAGYSSSSPVAPLPGQGGPRANYMKGAPTADLAYVETPGGVRAQVNKSAQPAFAGFLSDLEAAGAPIKDVGSYNPRKIAGTDIWSQHAHGNAIDINQTGRNQVSPEFRAWAAANPDKLSEIERKHNMVSGANFKSGGPDFGHWEWGGPTAGGKALAFNGEPVNANTMPKMPGAPDSPEAVANALAPGGLGGATPPLPKSTPVGDTGAPPAGVFTGRPQISRQQMHSILSNPWVTQANKDAYQQMYLQQNAPSQLEGTGGTWIMGRDQKPYFVPKDVWNEEKAGDVSTKTPMRYDPVTKSWGMVPITGGSAAPSKGPAPTDVPNLQYATPGEPGKGMLDLNGLPPEILTGQSAGKPSPASAIPNMPDFEGEKPQPVPQTPPDLEKTMLNYAPPDGGDLAPVAASAKAGTEGKTAQLSPRMQSLINTDIDIKQRSEAAKKEADSYQKKYDTLTQVGQRAAASRPMLEFARKLVDNKDFYSGPLADPVIDFKRLKGTLFNDPNAAVSNEALTKVISGQILEDMKISLQGLGQVRVAEIDLLSKAAANQYMRPASNRLILDLMMKAHDKADTVGKITAGYQAGARWDKDGKVIRDSKGNVVVHDGPPKLGELDGNINKYLEKNPILTKEEQDKLKSLIANPDKGYGAPDEPAKRGKYATERPQPKLKPAEKQAPPAPRPATAPPAGYE